MTEHRLLSSNEFRACFAEPMRDVTSQAHVAVDIWPYVDSLDRPTLGIAEIRDVAHVYRDGGDRFDQVLLTTDRRNAFVVILVDLSAHAIHGHHLLDLNEEYGLDRS